jgi:putative serine protease PepD
MVGAGTGGAAIALALDDDSTTTTAPTSLDIPASSTSNNQSSQPEGLARVADAVLPSVVSITADEGNGEAQGSGVIISEDGRILTNNHVAEGGANGGSLQVTFANGDTADATIVGRDPATDLAVIQAEDVSGLQAASLGSSADLHVGDTVLAIGSPLGLNGSVTSGIVSAVNRSITLGGESQGSPFGEQSSPGTTASINAIQTDAAINPGNSGGPLINDDGQVVGINTAIASTAGLGGTGAQSGNIGVGFAIPIDDARDVAQQLVRNGEVQHAYLGVEIADADTGGALVGGVESSSPADDAGLRQGDVITKVDDTDITNSAALTAAIRSHEPDDEVTITYTRNGDEHTTDVQLAALPND